MKSKQAADVEDVRVVPQLPAGELAKAVADGRAELRLIDVEIAALNRRRHLVQRLLWATEAASKAAHK